MINDTLFFRSLLNFLINNKEGHIISFNAIPLLSLYVVESQKYLSSVNPAVSDMLQSKFGDFFETSRNRIKLFDENSSIDEIAAKFEDIVQSQHQDFISIHTGILGWLKRIRQDDIGIYVFNGHIINTTHTVLYNLGLDSYKEVKRIKNQQLLRNILVHYEIRNVPESILNTTKPLSGIVEHFFKGVAFNEIDTLIDKQLERIGSILREWSA